MITPSKYFYTSVSHFIARIILTDDVLGTNELTLSGDDADHFTIVDDDLMLRAGVLLDYETQSSLNVTVEVDDASVGASPDDRISASPTPSSRNA